MAIDIKKMDRKYWVIGLGCVAVVAACAWLFMGGSYSQYGGRWYCGNGISYDFNMSKKTMAMSLDNFSSGVPLQVLDFRIVSESDKGILIDLNDKGQLSLRRNEDRLNLSDGIMMKVTCSKDPNFNPRRLR